MVVGSFGPLGELCVPELEISVPPFYKTRFSQFFSLREEH